MLRDSSYFEKTSFFADRFSESSRPGFAGFYYELKDSKRECTNWLRECSLRGEGLGGMIGEIAMIVDR
jgi:hypothetical protein